MRKSAIFAACLFKLFFVLIGFSVTMVFGFISAGFKFLLSMGKSMAITSFVSDIAGQVLQGIGFSVGAVFLGMTMLYQHSDGNYVLKGNLPMDGWKNASFVCVFPPFETQKFADISENGQLTIGDNVISDGKCMMRKVNIPFLFVSTWQGLITLSEGKYTWFQMAEEKMDVQVATEFSEIINIQDDVQMDIDSMIDFDHELGSTSAFQIEEVEPDVVKVKFDVNGIGSYDVDLKPAKKFDDETHPFESVWTGETNDATFTYNKRRQNIPYFMANNGIITFKQPVNDYSAIIFGTDGKEVRFQGKKVGDDEAEIEPIEDEIIETTPAPPRPAKSPAPIMPRPGDSLRQNSTEVASGSGGHSKMFVGNALLVLSIMIFN